MQNELLRFRQDCLCFHFHAVVEVVTTTHALTDDSQLLLLASTPLHTLSPASAEFVYIIFYFLRQTHQTVTFSALFLQI